MERTDSNIHRMELLITLDYLLNYSNEANPAKQASIVEYALNKYDYKAKRQRISDTLYFLEDFSKDYNLPFSLKTTTGGKYYVDIRHGVDNTKLIELIQALKNDKYFNENDKDYYINILLNTFSNNIDKASILDSIKTSKIRSQKTIFNRKLEVVKKALQEDKLLKLEYKIYKNENEYEIYEVYSRVYKIIEYSNRPYALIIPIKTKPIKFLTNTLLKPIDELEIPIKKSDREILIEDEARDLDKLFRTLYPEIFTYYSSVDDYIEKTLMPKSGKMIKVTFYFQTILLDTIRKSFFNYFNEVLSYKIIKTDELIKEYNVKPNLIKEDIVLVSMTIDYNAFLSWGFTDPHNEGLVNIFDMIDIISPNNINETIKKRYLSHLKKYER